MESWQADWLQDAFAPGVKEATLSIARRNGKSFLIGVEPLAHLCGPLVRANWRAAVVSLTGKLATELREAVRQIAEASGLGGQIEARASPVPGFILGQQGTRVDILAADKSSGHAIGIDLGGSVSMGAAAAYWPECGRLECWCAFPALPKLEARGRADGVAGEWRVRSEKA